MKVETIRFPLIIASQFNRKQELASCFIIISTLAAHFIPKHQQVMVIFTILYSLVIFLAQIFEILLPSFLL